MYPASTRHPATAVSAFPSVTLANKHAAEIVIALHFYNSARKRDAFAMAEKKHMLLSFSMFVWTYRFAWLNFHSKFSYYLDISITLSQSASDHSQQFSLFITLCMVWCCWEIFFSTLRSNYRSLQFSGVDLPWVKL